VLETWEMEGAGGRKGRRCAVRGVLTFRVQNSDQRIQPVEEELQEQLRLHDAEHPQRN
jgi:hypothetical protein